MSLSDYKVTLRLPSTLEGYIRGLSEEYGLSFNEAVKNCIIEHKRHTDVAKSGITSGITLPQPQVKSGITSGIISTQIQVSGEVEKKGNGITHDTTSDTTSDTITSPLGAPYILYILKNNKYKLIISDQRLKEAWDDFCAFRKAKRKTINNSQFKQTFRDFESIYEVEGIEGIIERLNKAVSAGYTGWYFGKDTLKARPVTVTNGNFTEDDF